MKNLNRWEIANHINTSVKETYPFNREHPAENFSGGKRTAGVEFSSRQHNNPQGHSRDDRSFSQSLWGRR